MPNATVSLARLIHPGQAPSRLPLILSRGRRRNDGGIHDRAGPEQVVTQEAFAFIERFANPTDPFDSRVSGHAARDVGLLERASEFSAGELATQICVHELRRPLISPGIAQKSPLQQVHHHQGHDYIASVAHCSVIDKLGIRTKIRWTIDFAASQRPSCRRLAVESFSIFQIFVFGA